MTDMKAMKRRVAYGAAVLLVPSVLFPVFAVRWSPPPPWYGWVFIIAAAELFACCSMGFICMMLGGILWLFDRGSSTSQDLIRFGAGLGVIVFSVLAVLSVLGRIMPWPRNGGGES